MATPRVICAVAGVFGSMMLHTSGVATANQSTIGALDNFGAAYYEALPPSSVSNMDLSVKSLCETHSNKPLNDTKSPASPPTPWLCAATNRRYIRGVGPSGVVSSPVVICDSTVLFNWTYFGIHLIGSLMDKGACAPMFIDFARRPHTQRK